MSSLTLALSLSNSFTKVGAIAAFVALGGIALLTLLIFSQAREIKRLREWAGRAPERAAELEQRVSADAGTRVQRERTAPGAPAARVVPRTTPLVSAPVASAVSNAAAAATGSHSVAPVGAVPASSPAAVPAATPAGAAAADVAVPETASPATPAVVTATVPDDASAPATIGPVAEETGEQPSASAAEQPSEDSVAEQRPVGDADAIPVAASAAAASETGEQDASADDAGSPEADEMQGVAAATNGPVPATAAARAGARSPLPPAPRSSGPARAVPLERAATPVAVRRETGPGRAVPGRMSGPPGGARRAAAGIAAGGVGRGAEGARGGPSQEPAPKYYRREGGRGRTGLLIVGGAIVLVLVIVLVVSALKGSGGSHSPATGGSSSATSSSSSTSSGHHGRGASAGAGGGSETSASNPAETSVTVLNGTSTAGLAHHLASDLQQSGYTLAAASAAVPPGTHSSTVIEYAHGHRADAVRVAKALNVTHVQPVEGSTSTLTGGSASVVVIAGADQAAQLGGTGGQSQGEPAAGGGTAAP